MKFIFSFLFGILLISPVFAECSSTTPANDCTCAGWGWDNNTDECKSCSYYEYSPANDSICHPCAIQSGNTWNWEPNVQHPDYSVYDNDHATTGQSECPWKCDTNYYENNDACEHCPNNSTSPDGSNSINDCKCNAGYYMGGANNNECKPCPLNSTNCNNSGSLGLSYDTVTCNNGYVPVIANDNTVTCQQCPPNTAPNGNGQCECQITGAVITPTTYGETCECGYNSQLSSDNTQCVCDPNGAHPTTSVEDGVVHCTACSDGATYNTQALACECNANYYGDGQTCKRCPPGTTKTAGGYIITTSTGTVDASTSISDCHMSSATKFCTGSGNDKKCMQLIPSNATNINQSGS